MRSRYALGPLEVRSWCARGTLLKCSKYEFWQRCSSVWSIVTFMRMHGGGAPTFHVHVRNIADTSFAKFSCLMLVRSDALHCFAPQMFLHVSWSPTITVPLKKKFKYLTVTVGCHERNTGRTVHGDAVGAVWYGPVPVHVTLAKPVTTLPVY